MPTIEYRLFFNNSPAKQEQLDLVEEITVEQDVDMAWEARLEIPICTDDTGKWSQEDEKILAYRCPIAGPQIHSGDGATPVYLVRTSQARRQRRPPEPRAPLQHFKAAAACLPADDGVGSPARRRMPA